MQNRIYIENLPGAVNADSLGEMFGRMGKVASVTLMTDSETGSSKGYGFIEMSTEAEARNAIHELNGTELQGNRVTVTLAGPVQGRTAGFRGGLNRSERKNR